MTVAGSVRGRRSDFRALAEWRKVRLVVLKRDNHRCRIGLPGCLGRANEADHIIEVADGGARYDLANLRAACGPCNKRRNGAQQGERETVFRRRGSIDRKSVV